MCFLYFFLLHENIKPFVFQNVKKTIIHDIASVKVIVERIKLPVKILPCKSVYENIPLVLCGQAKTNSVRSCNTQFHLNSFSLGKQQHTLGSQKAEEMILSLSTKENIYYYCNYFSKIDKYLMTGRTDRLLDLFFWDMQL